MKTAVEWLYEELWKQTDFSLPNNLLEQAKNIEKKQLNDAYNSDRPNLCCFEENTAFKEYYKRTFKK
jgi:hypothetical protein